MGILATIFGSGEVIKDAFGLIDSMHTSTEEEIQAKTDQKVKVMASYAPFKIAQRYIGLLFTVNFLFCFQLVLWMVLLGKGDIDDVLKVLGMFYIGPIMVIIVTFYFGGGFGEGMLDKFNMGKKKDG